MKTYRGIDITRPLHVSSDLLRKYETWGLVPKASRGENGYRQYTEIHKQFFITARQMLIGFSWTEIARIMRYLVMGNREDATILSIEYQSELVRNYQDSKKIIIQLRSTIGNQPLDDQFLLKKIHRPITIGEVSNIINLPISTIRVWEKERLFEPIKQENNYRYFNQLLLNRLFIIKLLRLSGLNFDRCREVLSLLEMGENNYQEVLHVLENRLADMKSEINNGLKALGSLNQLIQFLEEVNYVEK